MTSTEFTIGLDGSRVSSKVLRPPGGGSSDIFGTGATQHSPNVTADKQSTRNQEAAPASTQNRLFGAQNDTTFTTGKRFIKSNIFEHDGQTITNSARKPYVRRNPITGEEIIMNPESSEKTENNDKEEINDNVQDNILPENGEEEKKTENPPTKPIQTSIRVRNPPGGKSSGIF